jgi:hypothetical protein
VWWHILVIPALGRQKREDCEFQGSLDYTVRPCLIKKKKVYVLKLVKRLVSLFVFVVGGGSEGGSQSQVLFH